MSIQCLCPHCKSNITVASAEGIVPCPGCGYVVKPSQWVSQPHPIENPRATQNQDIPDSGLPFPQMTDPSPRSADPYARVRKKESTLQANPSAPSWVWIFIGICAAFPLLNWIFGIIYLGTWVGFGVIPLLVSYLAGRGCYAISTSQSIATDDLRQGLCLLIALASWAIHIGLAVAVGYYMMY